jgi:hypothetical protein
VHLWASAAWFQTRKNGRGCQWFRLGLEVFSRRIELSVIQNHCMIAISARQESRKNSSRVLSFEKRVLFAVHVEGN